MAPARYDGPPGATEAGRPRLHFTPQRGWVNDPHGLTWHDGLYHLFFQHVPRSSQWAAETCWGHAVSDDLVHWTERPVVLAPEGDDGGIWSGSLAVTDEGAAHLFYTAVRTGAWDLGHVRTARPEDEGWDVWRRSDVVVSPPPDLDLAHFRDPCVLHDGSAWRMVVGGGTTGGTALATTWTSQDLLSWTYGGVLASRSGEDTDGTWTGTVWECVQLFPLGRRWVLLVSVWHRGAASHEAYSVGDLVEGRFEPGPWRRLTYGPGLYAGSAFTDAHGQPGLVHWLRGVADPQGAWAGAHSVPHRVRLEEDRLLAEPHPVVRSACEELRPGSQRQVGDTAISLEPDQLVVRRDGGTFTVPYADGPVLLLVDGPAVELFTPNGVAGFAVRGDAGRV